MNNVNDFQRLCPGCMHPLLEGAQVCPHCSTSIHETQHAPLLPLMTVLSGRFLVGLGRLSSTDSAVYVGFDMALGVPVTINEFFPKNLVVRGEGESAVRVRMGYDVMFQTCRKSFIALWKTLMSLNRTPALPNVKEIFFENETAYAVCERFESITLEEYLRTAEKTLDWPKVKYVFRPILAALKAMNSRFLVHAAVSPETVLVGADGQLHLSGFSILQTKSDIIELHALSSPGFAALELSDRRLKIGEYTDVYSAMAVMYKMLTGITPQNAADRAVSDMMVIPQEYAKTLDEKTVGTILSALKIYPEGRIQTIDALCALLYPPQGEKAPAEKNQPASSPEKKPTQQNSAAKAQAGREAETKNENQAEKSAPAVRSESETALTVKVVFSVLLVAAMVFLTAYTTFLYKYFDVPFIDTALANVSFLPMNGETQKTTAEQTTAEQTEKSSGPVEYVKVADFSQLTYRDILSSETFKNNYEIEFKFEASDDVEKNSIISQSVKPGETVEKGTKITVVVSSGKPYVVLRDVMGMKYEDAAKLLETDGFKVQKVMKKNNGTREPGTVCTMSLVAGLEFEKGTTITLTVWDE